MKKLIFLILIAAAPVLTRAQVDAVRAATIEIASKQAKKTIDAQIKIQGLETAGHMWIISEVDATTAFQREFNSYLDMFHDVLSIGAEIYGIYYEVTKTSKNIQNLTEVVAESPSNILAVAFSTKRNIVYRNIVKTSLDIIMDIKKVCFESSKMTEQEKNNIISSIRPKLRTINKQLSALTLAIRYTSFMDVWNEVTNRYLRMDSTRKHDIITRCRRDWWNNAKSVK